MNSHQLQWLFDRFADDSARHALIWKDRPVSYGQLLDRISHWQSRLAENGVGAGTVVSIEGDYSPEAVAVLLAALDRSAIIVPFSTGVPQQQRPEFRRIAEVGVIVALSGDDGATVEQLQTTPLQNPLLQQLRDLGDPGLVLFSSGSTGKSKAALHNAKALLRKFEAKRYSLTTLAFLLLDHIGGINTLLYVLSNAGTLVCIEDRNPDVICAAIALYKVELLPTSPTFLNLLLLSEAYRLHDLSSLKRITYGTEVMPPRTLERIHAILPHVELQQTYGLSEIGILRSKSRSSDSLWVKVGGEDFDIKVQDGTLWVKARCAMTGYLNAPSPFDADGWFNTGDAVEIDGEYLRIMGRKSEIINVGGEKVYPAEVESVLLDMPNVSDVTVSGAANPVTGQFVVARFNLNEPEEPASFRRRVREFCQGRLAPFKVPAKIEIISTEQFNARYKKMRLAQAHAAQS